jgi:hypothetical protein
MSSLRSAKATRIRAIKTNAVEVNRIGLSAKHEFVESVFL